MRQAYAELKCLIVDDSAITRRILVNSLHAIGCRSILEAVDGGRALALCTPDVDLILTDWNMPGLSGQELVQGLRANPDLAAIPVLLVTTRSGKDDVAQAMSAGVDGYILKPFTPEALATSIADVLPRRRRTGTGG